MQELFGDTSQRCLIGSGLLILSLLGALGSVVLGPRDAAYAAGNPAEAGSTEEAAYQANEQTVTKVPSLVRYASRQYSRKETATSLGVAGLTVLGGASLYTMTYLPGMPVRGHIRLASRGFHFVRSVY